jgi:hypothetical protein
MLTRRSALIVVGVLLLAGTAAWAAAKTAKPKPDPANDPYKLLCDAYLDGKWEDVEKTLAAKILPPSLRQHGAEVTAIRTTVTECRPGWWETCKANFGGKFSPVVWGQTLDATFAPGDKTSTQMNQANNNISFTITWPAGEMDNPAEAEHGFSRGDLMDLGIWGQLGTALSWKQVSPQSLGNLSPTDKLALMRYQDFRSNVTGLYYGTPKARRWGLFLYLLAWKNDYAKLPTVNARKANGAMFLAEVLTEPSKYPSLPLPKEEPAEKTEEKLAEQYRDWIETHGLTLAEDNLLRAAIKKFAQANYDWETIRTKQIVTLNNKLRISLDPLGDEKFRPERDAWLKKQLQKAILAEKKKPPVKGAGKEGKP